MKILVTGGAGFIGTNLIKRLIEDGHKVSSLDNYSTGFKRNEQEGCQYFDIDISEISDYSFFMDKPDVIFHLAALARIQPSLKKPTKTIHNNFISTLNVLEYARNTKSKVIYSGSSTVHHGLYGSPYAWSKYGGEQLCELYSKVYNVSTAIARFYNVYGKHQLEDGEYATILGIFERQFRNNEPFTIVGDGEQRRDFTHIDDIVDALVLISKKEFKGEKFELGRGKNYSINEIADMFDKNYQRITLPQRSGEYPFTLADNTFVKNKLGWSPKKRVSDYIKRLDINKKDEK
jgi:UDP-glucose 4-epimerase